MFASLVGIHTFFGRLNMDTIAIGVVVAYAVCLGLIIAAIAQMKDKANFNPFFLGLVALVILWFSATYGVEMSAFMGAISWILLYAMVPLLNLALIPLGVFYVYEAFFTTTVGRVGGASVGTYNKQYELGGLIAFILVVLCFMLMWTWQASAEHDVSLVPPTSSIAQVMDIGKELDAIREEGKKLNVDDSPFTITFYAEDFDGTKFTDAFKPLIEAKLAKMDLKLLRFERLRFERISYKRIDVIAQTIVVRKDVADPSITDEVSASVRAPILTPDGTSVWVQEHIFPRVQALRDSAEGTGKIAPKAKTPAEVKKRNGDVGSEIEPTDDGGVQLNPST
jgi:hypothetical protein